MVLLERGKGGVRLTSDGIRLMPFIKNICSDYQKLAVQVDELNGLQSGMIRIGTFTSVSSHWIPNIMARFQKDHPLAGLDKVPMQALVENGFGISILPKQILHRVPYSITAKSMEIPAYRRIGFAVRSRKTASMAVRCFMNYIQYRKG